MSEKTTPLGEGARPREPAGVPETFVEGVLVRSTSDLYKGYGVGRVVKVRNEHAKVEFNPSVFMAPPYRSENKILHFSEMERVETPLERAARGEWEEPWRFELKMQAARFLTGNKGGQLGNARTEILPHQVFARGRLVASRPVGGQASWARERTSFVSHRPYSKARE